MPALHIRHVDDAVVDALKRRAAEHHRSLEGELREILREMAWAGTSKARRRGRIKLDLKTVAAGSRARFGRDEIYGDEGTAKGR